MKTYPHTLIILLVILSMTGTITGTLTAAEKTTRLKFNFSERFRFEGWDNAISLDEDATDATGYTRNRTSLSALWLPNQELEIMVKLTNEFRNYITPKNKAFNFHEVFVDQLYLKWKNTGKFPLTLTLGRQNIQFGEGFIIMDGTPLDGSRALYFNAVRADYQWHKKHRLTLFCAYQPATDTLLPLINDKNQALATQPELATGIYYTGMFSKTAVEAYFVRKDIDDTALFPIKADIHTLGTRIQHPFLKQLSLTFEGAYQFGNRGDFDRSAFGGYTHLDYTFSAKMPLVRSLVLGAIYLSGDDPGTPAIEGWDPVYSRWPKWSESYVYTLSKENGIAYWSNLKTLYCTLTMDLTSGVNLIMTYFRLGANEKGNTTFTGGTGKTRGDLFIGRMNIKINAFTTAHCVWEHFNPGNFYFAGANKANWLRFEVLFQF